MPAKKRAKKPTVGPKFLKDYEPKHYRRIMGIDASTRGVAVVLLIDGRPRMKAHLLLKSSDIHERMLQVKKWFPSIIELYKPEFCIIEQPIYIQNPQTTKNISYVVGIIMGEILLRQIEVGDVGPSAWKRLVGYQILTKKRQQEINDKLGATEGRKEINRLRKSQTMDIMTSRFPEFTWDNDDEADAAGVALYGYEYWGK